MNGSETNNNVYTVHIKFAIHLTHHKACYKIYIQRLAKPNFSSIKSHIPYKRKKKHKKKILIFQEYHHIKLFLLKEAKKKKKAKKK